MKRLWRGEDVTFEGTYTKLTGARMGFTPCQRPHPPLEMGAQSTGATRRAARLVDAVFFGPQVSWADVGPREDRKSTRLNSSHSQISYAVFCLKKKKQVD